MHAIAMRGEPALPENFDHFPYANPEAKKGGRLSLAFYGTFDSLNPFNLKAGSTAQGLNGNIFQTLMIRSQDEPFTLYGQIAETIETDDARSYATFRLNPNAHFSNGDPITSKDVDFTFNLLKEKGRPQQQAAFAKVSGVDIIDQHTIRFDLSTAKSREMPMTLALMPVLSAHITDVGRFEDANLDIPIGSGPYIMTQMKPGERLLLKRDPNYWANDLPITKGLFNFDEINISYFRDATAMFEAFRSGTLDFRQELNALRWLNGYHFQALDEGRVRREIIKIGGPKGMDGLAFNTRRPLFADIRLREALGMMFDFEWVNTHVFGELYQRTNSFYANSDLASSGRPANAAELALIAPWPGLVRQDFLDGSWRAPVHDGSGNDREWAAKAIDLLQLAGFHMDNGQMVKDARPLRFEILVQDRNEQRLALDFSANLQRIGVEAEVRMVDNVQYQRRRQNYDYDMIFGSWYASASPGEEQRGRWGSVSLDIKGSYNLVGAHLPAIDALIDKMGLAKDQDEFIHIVRIYDRLLLSQFYIIPLYHTSYSWNVARSDLAYPAYVSAFSFPPFGSTLENWWWQK